MSLMKNISRCFREHNEQSDRIDRYQQQEDELNVALGGHCRTHDERIAMATELRKAVNK